MHKIKFSKRTKVLIGLLVALILVGGGYFIWAWKTGIIKFAAKTNEENITQSNPQPPNQEHILVKFKKNVSETRRNQIHQKTGGKVKDKIDQIDVQIVDIPKGKGITPEAFVETYKGNFKDELEYAEVDEVISPSLWPNDPYFNYGQLQLQWMGAPQAWDITIGDPNLKIAVSDSGCDFTHQDLQGRLIAGWDFWDNDADPSDVYGHGTWVTGVLGAVTNNAYGIAGVSWRNPVLCIRDGDATTTSGLIAKGITYAADQGARAINISSASPSYSSTGATAVDYAWNKGAVTVAGAGNSSTSTPYYPAALPKVIAVSGVTGDDVIWYGSNYGSWIDVSAPCNSQTTALGGGISIIGGTSMSAPFVTGLLGLVFSANPGLTAQQAVDIVTSTAKDLGDPGFDQYYGWGKIDIYQAVLKASGTPQPTTGNIAGKITDASTGLGLSSATVTALQSGVTKAQIQTASDGTYTLNNLAAGTYDVKAEKLNYQSQTQTGKTVTAGQTITVNFALVPQPTTGNITGRVTDASTGLALASATVSAYQSGNLIKSTTTLSDGTYTLADLNAGSYDVTAANSGYQSQTKTGVAVTAGQTTSGINFSLTPNPQQQYGSLTGSVTNSSGQIVAGAKVTLTAGSTSYSTTTNSSGVYTFTNIPVGTYTLKATTKGGLSYTQTNVQIVANTTTTINFLLSKTGGKPRK